MRFFLSLLIFLSVSSLAQADTIRRSIPANKTSSVGAHATYNAQCMPSSIPKMKIAKQPENGTVSFKQVAFKLSEDAGRCAGRQVKGIAVYYKPKRGFRGQDEFKVRFTMDMYSARSAKIRNVVDKYIVEVK
ncbi:hypothetical protein CLV41_1011321 [Roseibium marinum]|uniref:Uncharacterized protein n=1 Tax=Roseibium marinum TaxID=281252 RepID=A0A2S3V4H4_9HYPH|nr:hypothetical protein CLV41_1011321 [Roseibium marinum]